MIDDLFPVKVTAADAAPRLYRKRSIPSKLINEERLSQDPVMKIAAHEIRCVEVNLWRNSPAQLVLDSEEIPAQRPTRLELDKDVDVAVRPELVTQHGPEHGKPPDLVPAAKIGDAVFTESAM